MNIQRFERLMNAIDDSFLEEAQHPVKKKRSFLRPAVSIAACLCLVAALAVWQLRQITREAVTLEDVRALGYNMQLPEQAENITYEIIDSDSQGVSPAAQATFTQDGTQYVCRAQKTQLKSFSDSAELIADDVVVLEYDGFYLSIASSIVSSDNPSNNSSYVLWYSDDSGVQWTITSEEDASSVSLMGIAQYMMANLGYDIASAPDGAENVEFNVISQNGLTISETTFTFEGVSYSYRIASIDTVPENIPDISGVNQNYQSELDENIQGHSAKLFFTSGGSGKVIWFDVVPGLAYSLTVDSGAEQQLLMDMANSIFTPAQGDVG